MTKKGPMSEQELKKREATYIERYGSAEALANKRREWQKKSRKNYDGKKTAHTQKEKYGEDWYDQLSKKAVEARRGKNVPK